MKEDIGMCRKPCGEVVIKMRLLGTADLRKLWSLFYNHHGDTMALTKIQHAILVKIASVATTQQERWLAYRRSEHGSPAERYILGEIIFHSEYPIEIARAKDALTASVLHESKVVLPP